ncbi:hypothetical protein D0869_09967 [Hortaea werneckii]|uniref:Nudix hydrolase domain-containing protein n=1 Tax=Hortaea werneckii TaxID=91943 RepID=A0A3M6WG07_HORWE|nr:hypothetical protein KC324_g12522 [Hortaea werneckii]KAI7577882.1 hypothetical protein KC316_g10115 [Hortaea werneckii]RMX77341.1 hypothetical protein D0869_09967 [Hortaea werneckii]
MSGCKTTYLDLVRDTDNFPLDPAAKDSYYELYLPYDDTPHGYLLEETVDKMPWTNRFTVQREHPRRVTVHDTSEGKDTSKAVNEAFAEVINECVDRKLFHLLDGKHSEPFAILGANYPAYLERFAAALFGTMQCGASMVCYTNTPEGMKLWIPRRAAHLYTGANMLDNTVAGGVKAGAAPLETLIREADEEASLPEDLVRRLVRARGVLTCMQTTGPEFKGEKGLVLPDVNYVYDMELPEGVVPKPHDEEVKDYYCMSVSDVQTALLNREFKEGPALVVIDFLMRHNIITPETEPDYVDISMHLHRRLPFRIAPSKGR